jgi:hypothetical protein
MAVLDALVLTGHSHIVASVFHDHIPKFTLIGVFISALSD